MSDATNPYAPTSPDAAASSEGALYLDPPQTVQYRYTAELLAAFWTHRTLHSPGDRRVRRQGAWRIALIGLVPFLATLAAVWQDWANGWVAVGGGLFAVWMLALAWQTRRPSAIQLAYAHAANRMLDEASNEHFLAERTLAIAEDGVRQTMPQSESFIRWPAFERIDNNDNYLFLYESSFTALVVPRAAFVSRSHYLGFVGLAQRLWEVNRQRSTN